MSKKDLTEIIVVLDRSGSMQSIRKDMEGGFDQFVSEQRKLPGDALVTLAQFDTEYGVVYSGKKLADVPALALEPRGGTALLDAVGKTINEVGLRLKNTTEEDRPERVLFVIITDGGENASREFTNAQVKKMVEHQTGKYSWQFVYIGANQDSFANAGAIGIAAAFNFAADSAGTSRALHNMSVGTANYRSGGGYGHGNGQP